MATPDEEALPRQIMETIEPLIGSILSNEAEAAAALLAPGSFAELGLQLFGLGALGIPLGFEAGPQQLGVTSIEGGGELAVAELLGRDEQGQDLSVCSIILVQMDDAWRVADLWPVPMGMVLDPELVADPAAQLYTGEAYLPLLPEAPVDAVEALLIPGLQEWAIGLHLIERGVRLWRDFVAGNRAAVLEPAPWAAAVHHAVLLLDFREADPAALASYYGVTAQIVTPRFKEIVARLDVDQFDARYGVRPDPQAEEPRILDLSGNPMPRRRQPLGGGSASGPSIILPHG